MQQIILNLGSKSFWIASQGEPTGERIPIRVGQTESRFVCKSTESCDTGQNGRATIELEETYNKLCIFNYMTKQKEETSELPV